MFYAEGDGDTAGAPDAPLGSYIQEGGIEDKGDSFFLEVSFSLEEAGSNFCGFIQQLLIGIRNSIIYNGHFPWI